MFAQAWPGQFDDFLDVAESADAVENAGHPEASCGERTPELPRFSDDHIDRLRCGERE